MDLSIIIPVYNTPMDVLYSCLDSINFNSEVSYEILLIDDGSEEKYSNQYKLLSKPNLKYYRQNNKGVSTARNIGIRNASGTFCCFLDSDDCLITEYIENSLFKKDADLVLFNKVYLYNNSSFERRELNVPEGVVEISEVAKEYICNNRMHSPVAKLIRTQILKDNDIYFPTDFIEGEDAIFNDQIIRHITKIIYIDKPMYLYKISFTTNMNRWLRFPEIMFRNQKDLYFSKKELISFFSFPKPEDLMRRLDQNMTNTVFQSYIMFIEAQADDLYFYKLRQNLDDMGINIKHLSMVYKVKYALCKYDIRTFAFVLSHVRKIYLTTFKKEFK